MNKMIFTKFVTTYIITLFVIYVLQQNSDDKKCISTAWELGEKLFIIQRYFLNKWLARNQKGEREATVDVSVRHVTNAPIPPVCDYDPVQQSFIHEGGCHSAAETHDGVQQSSDRRPDVEDAPASLLDNHCPYRKKEINYDFSKSATWQFSGISTKVLKIIKNIQVS